MFQKRAVLLLLIVVSFILNPKTGDAQLSNAQERELGTLGLGGCSLVAGFITFGVGLALQGVGLGVVAYRAVTDEDDRRRRRLHGDAGNYTTPATVTPVVFPSSFINETGQSWSQDPIFQNLFSQTLLSLSSMMDNVRLLHQTIDKYYDALDAGAAIFVEMQYNLALQHISNLNQSINSFAADVRAVELFLNGTDYPDIVYSLPINTSVILELLDDIVTNVAFPAFEQEVVDIVNFTDFELQLIATEIQAATENVNASEPCSCSCLGSTADVFNSTDVTDFIPDDFPYPPVSGSVSGDPYYKTLDGLRFKYDGPCSYLLLSNDPNKCNQLKPVEASETKFVLIAHHGRCRSRRKNVICIKSVTLQINNDKFEIQGQNKLFKNDIEITEKQLPYKDDTTSMLIMAKRRLDSISGLFYQDYYVKSGEDFSFVVSNDGIGSVTFQGMNSKYMNNTCGMLGNYDGNYKNDLQLSDGTALSGRTNDEFQTSVIKMGDDWMVPTQSQPLRCKWYPKTSFLSTKTCSYWPLESVKDVCDQMVIAYSKEYRGNNMDKCFTKNEMNHQQVDGTRIYDDCITEICECGLPDIKSCEPFISLGLFKSTCLTNGASRSDFPHVSFSEIVDFASKTTQK